MIKLYDSMLGRIRDLTKDLKPVIYDYDESRAWPEDSEFRILFQKDTAYELGGERTSSANLTCVTSDPSFFQGNQILVCGPDLQEIKCPVSYVRICEVLVREEDLTGKDLPEAILMPEDTDRLYKLVQDMDFVKYHVFPKGFMLRSSGQSAREQVRVGSEAIREGLSFERIGNTFLSHYLQREEVLSARILFITEPTAPYPQLQKEAALATDIRNSLSALQKGLDTDCGSCSIRDICNEVEGLRELHFGKKRTEGFPKL